MTTQKAFNVEHTTPLFDSLYVYRHVNWEDAQAIIDWAHSQGIKTTLPSYELHVTIVYSKVGPFWDWDASERERDKETLLIRGGERKVSKLGDDGDVLVLEIESPELLERHQELLDYGASSDYPTYRAHITITYNGEGVDEGQIEPYTGDIRLDAESWQPVRDNPYSKELEVSDRTGFKSYGEAQVLKVHSEIGLVVGYAIVSKINGEDYYDHHEDHIPEDSMLKASVEFMKSSRVSTDMHTYDKAGQPTKDGDVVFAFPMTTDIAKSLGITVEKTGLLVGIMPSPAVLEKYKSGQYTGFSIGGRRIKDEDVE